MFLFFNFLVILNQFSTFYINGLCWKKKNSFFISTLLLSSVDSNVRNKAWVLQRPYRFRCLISERAMWLTWSKTPVGLSHSELHVARAPQTRACTESSGGLVKAPTSGSTPRVFDSGSLGWDLRICISNKFQNDADAVGPGTTF